MGVTKRPLHPSTKAGATEDDLFAIAIDDFGARYSEVRSHGTRRSLKVRRQMDSWEGKDGLLVDSFLELTGAHDRFNLSAHRGRNG